MAAGVCDENWTWRWRYDGEGAGDGNGVEEGCDGVADIVGHGGAWRDQQSSKVCPVGAGEVFCLLMRQWFFELS